MTATHAWTSATSSARASPTCAEQAPLRAHMFGIAWGIASVVFLVALVAGFADGARKSMATLGRDLMIVWGGRTSPRGAGVARANHPIRLR